jgi:hypothetical protein
MEEKKNDVYCETCPLDAIPRKIAKLFKKK